MRILGVVIATIGMLAGATVAFAGDPPPPFDVDHPMLHAWFEAGEGVNDIPPGDGDAVLTWSDLSGHERHLVRVDARSQGQGDQTRNGVDVG